MRNLKSAISRIKTFSIVLLAALAYACNTEEEATEEIELTEQDVAEVIAASLSEEDAGMMADVEKMTESISEECGYTYTESLTDSDDSEDRSYSVDYDYSLEVMCDEEGTFLRTDYSYTSYRDAELIRFDVSNSTESIWAFYHDADNYKLEGSYAYEGVEAYKVRHNHSLSSDIDYSSSNLIVDENGNFLKGTLAFSELVKINEETWEHSGSLEITEENIALLDVSGFEFLYEINLVTGEITEVKR